MNLLQKLLALIFRPSVSGAISGIEKSLKALAVVEAHHVAEVVKHDAAIAKAKAKAALSQAEADLAAKVKANVSVLLGKA